MTQTIVAPFIIKNIYKDATMFFFSRYKKMHTFYNVN